MKTVVVGGNSRNIGKTSVMTGLIRALRSLDWTAVKITQYGHGICSRNGQPCGCKPKEHPFVLSEENDLHGLADTCRFLAAGARRSLWLRVRQGQLGEAYPLLERAIRDDPFVIIESNSVLAYLQPSLYLVVLNTSKNDFKSSCRQFLDHSSALVTVQEGIDVQKWSAFDRRRLQNKPVFPVTTRNYFSDDLCSFVSGRLSNSAAREAAFRDHRRDGPKVGGDFVPDFHSH
jgi:hypothetical protein